MTNNLDQREYLFDNIWNAIEEHKRMRNLTEADQLNKT